MLGCSKKQNECTFLLTGSNLWYHFETRTRLDLDDMVFGLV